MHKWQLFSVYLHIVPFFELYPLLFKYEYLKYLFSSKATPIFSSNLISQHIVKLMCKRINNILYPPVIIKGEAGGEKALPLHIQCYDSVLRKRGKQRSSFWNVSVGFSLLPSANLLILLESWMPRFFLDTGEHNWCLKQFFSFSIIQPLPRSQGCRGCALTAMVVKYASLHWAWAKFHSVAS